MEAGDDTIAAIATPPGRGGIGIVRVSGPATALIAKNLLASVPAPRVAVYRDFCDADGKPIDSGIALYFPAPNTFTGENVLELQGHGGPVVMDLLLARTLELGARQARPGEFSQRAFLNGKMDLAQAEAVADLIDSATATAARGAQRSLSGDFSQEVRSLSRQVAELRAFVEAAIDFPEEEIDFLADKTLLERLQALSEKLTKTLSATRQGVLLQEGLRVVIAGQPNVGKSSLLNALSGSDTAIVTHLPGTTRDLLREQIHLDGLPLHIIDTAGLRDTDDLVEQHGIYRARGAIAEADIVLLVVDASLGVTEIDRVLLAELDSARKCVVVRNKIDLAGESATILQGKFGSEVALSAKLGLGIELLRDCLKQQVGYEQGDEGSFTARRRHLDALRRAEQHIAVAYQCIQGARAGELMAEDLRAAQQSLGEITGEFSNEDLLDLVFSEFCIGK